jgi:hypothetical protein
MADKNELEEQVARLTALVEEMRSRMSRIEGAGRPSGPEAPRSRRELLKMGGAAALGAVGAAALRAMPAAATNGNPILAGSANTADSSTTLAGTTSNSVEVLGVQAVDTDSAGLIAALGTGSQFGGALQGLGGVSGVGVTNLRDGVDGWASGATSFGVYGLSDVGTGVAGESGGGVSLYARGSGRIEQDIHGLAAGVPDYDPSGNMEQVRDAAGTLWLSNAAGKWRRATTFEVFRTPGRVYGKGVLLPKGTIVLNIDATKTINLAPSGVPVGAVAAWCAISTYEPAVLSVYPAGSPDPHFPAWGMMGTAGLGLQVGYIMVPLNSSGKFSFTNAKSRARVYIDAWGYLSQSV